MKDRIASLVLVFAMLVSLCPSALAQDHEIAIRSGGAERFTDVPTSHWAYGYINKVVGSGLFNGKTSTSFEPSNAMTRSQFVLVLARMEGHSELEGLELEEPPFPDVTTTRLAAGPIAWAAEEGIVLGFGDGTFKPDSPITRGQFAALIHRYITMKGYTNLNVVDPEPDQFTDAASVNKNFTGDVEYARIHGLLTGYSDGTVRAGNPITRAAIAAILARFLDLVGESVDPDTGENYIPLLDYPRGDNGDSGDSGDSGGSSNEPFTNVDYGGIKKKVNNPGHGSAVSVYALRDGELVEADDLQPGDTVFFKCVPDNGYEVSVRVRDSKGKKVDVNKVEGQQYTYSFEAPKNLPVTITVTYSKISSGGGGGGGGGGSSGGGYSSTYYYSLVVDAQVTPTDGGAAHVSATAPTEGMALPASLKAKDTLTYSDAAYYDTGKSVSAYVWVVLNDGWSVKSVTPDKLLAKTVKAADGKTVVYYEVIETAKMSNPSTTTVAVTLEQGGTPATEWSVEATGTNAYVSLTAEQPTSNDALTANGETTLKPSASKAYLSVSPMSGYYLSKSVEPVVTNGTAKLVKPTTAADTDTLRVYEISKGSTNAKTTVSVTALSEKRFENPTYAVEVEAVLATVSDGKYTKTSNKPENVTQKAAPNSAVGAGDEVKITAQQTLGFGGYKVIAVEKDGVAIDSALINETGDAVERTFNMPAANAKVTVVYEKLKDDADLTYNVNVTFKDGAKGQMGLNVDGANYAVSDTDSKITVTMTHADYQAAYSEKAKNYGPDTPDEQWTLPIYISSNPVGADGYKFTGEASGKRLSKVTGAFLSTSDTLDDSYYTVKPGDNTVEVTLDKVYTLGYNLTVIGNGTVKLGDTEYKGGDIPQTYSKSFLDTKNERTLSVKMSDYGDINVYDYDVEVTGAGSFSGTTLTLREGTTDITVDFHKKDRQAVKFTVNVATTGGSVTVKPESGKLLNANGVADAVAAKAQLDAKNGLANDSVSKSGNNPQSYYVYEDTIVTLTPNPTGNYKTASVTVNGAVSAGGKTDILSKAGFSFKVTNGDSAEIKFGTAGKYSFLAQAPFDGTAKKGTPQLDLHSVIEDLDGNKTLQELLNSLNDKNNFHDTWNNLAKAFDYYFNGDGSGNSKDTGRENLTDMLQENVEGQLSDNLPNMIESKKAEMLQKDGNNPSAAETQLKQGLKDALAKANAKTEKTLPKDNQARADIIKELFKDSDAKKYYEDNNLTDNDITVSVAVEPDMAALETQLQSSIMLYLNQIKLEEGYTTPDATVKVDVKGYDANGKRNNDDALPTVITVSASAQFNLAKLPQLTKNFGSYVDQVPVMVSVTPTVTLKGRDAKTLSAMKYSVDDLGAEVIKAVKDEIRSKLTDANDGVDAKLADYWRKKLIGMMKDSSGKAISETATSGTGILTVDMADVLDKAMLDSVMDTVLGGDTVNKYLGKVESLGEDHKNTSDAFMNLYSKFVDLDTTDGLKLYLLTPKSKLLVGEPDEDGNLVITLDFEKIIYDKSAGDDTPYEKLVELLVALRNGIATDINLNSTDGQTAQSVVAELIAGQINSGKGNLTVNKWGQDFTNAQIRSSAESVKEASNLLAELMMDPLDTKLSDVSAKFEAYGYQSVQFTFNVNKAAVRDALTTGAGVSINPFGFRLAQKVTPLS